jgi:hypothetical protein
VPGVLVRLDQQTVGVGGLAPAAVVALVLVMRRFQAKRGIPIKAPRVAMALQPRHRYISP